MVPGMIAAGRASHKKAGIAAGRASHNKAGIAAGRASHNRSQLVGGASGRDLNKPGKSPRKTKKGGL